MNDNEIQYPSFNHPRQGVFHWILSSGIILLLSKNLYYIEQIIIIIIHLVIIIFIIAPKPLIAHGPLQ